MRVPTGLEGAVAGLKVFTIAGEVNSGLCRGACACVDEEVFECVLSCSVLVWIFRSFRREVVGDPDSTDDSLIWPFAFVKIGDGDVRVVTEEFLAAVAVVVALSWCVPFAVEVFQGGNANGHGGLREFQNNLLRLLQFD